MKEYIKNVLYEGSGLIIGMNDYGTSMIFGQNNEWIVLGENDVKNVVKKLSQNHMTGDMGGFDYSMRQKGILFNQQGHSVYVDRDVFAKFLP
jgi:hypothetical protein